MSNLDTAVDPMVLEALDFAIPCGHSQHGMEGSSHEGDAEFIAVSYHKCPATPEKPYPYMYPCCAVWADFIKLATEYQAVMECARCGEYGLWSEFVQITGTLT
jgi:hypothetical protein